MVSAQPCASPSASTDFERVPLVTGLTLPMAFEEAPDGRIFFIERAGDVKVYDPTTSAVSLVANIPVNTDAEFGLLGMALDPAFATNHYLYLYYATGGVYYETRVSRFTVTSAPLGLTAESVMLTIPQVLNFHVAGDMGFDSAGNLFLSTGSNDFAFNELVTGCAYKDPNSDCAQQTSSNKGDLRGKVLRIHPTSDGHYSIPSGNLFSPGDATHKPEIFTMGNRNPFRFQIDKQGGDVLYLAEVGSRYEEINRVTAAGYYGWPFYEGPNNYYPNTTGLTALTPWIYYHQDSHTSNVVIPGLFDAGVSAGRSVMAGPVYHYHSGVSNPKKLPASFDGDLLFWDFSKGLLWNVDMGAGGAINDTSVHAFLTGVGFGPAANTAGQNGTMDMAFSADDTLLALEYWSGTLYRVNYIGAGVNRTPVLAATASVTNGATPLGVTFSACPGGSAGCTSDPEGDALTYKWDFNGDGTDDLTSGSPTPSPYTYTTPGVYNARLRVQDTAGNTATRFFTITAGNHAPVVSFASPPDGGLFSFDDDVAFSLSVTDFEDGATPGTIDCADVSVQTAFGHDGHDHGGEYTGGCTGTFHLGESVDDPAHANVYYILSASYTDNAVGAAQALTTKKQILLFPKRKEAEFADVKQGVSVIANTDVWTGGDSALSDVDDGDYVVLAGRNLQSAGSVTYRVASGSSGGRIEMRLDSAAGTLLATTIVPTTGGFDAWTTVGSSFVVPSGKHDLYFVFKKNTTTNDTTDMFDLNWIEFTGSGVGSDTTRPTIESVSVGRDPNEIRLTWSEDLGAGAETAGNYTVTGATVQSARLLPGERIVRLTTTSLGVTSHTVTVGNVQDTHGNAVLSGTSAAFDYKGFDVPTGLNAYYRFDESTGSLAADSSGNGANGTLTGGYSRTPGALGNAAQLDGTTGYVDIPNTSLTGDFTFATWVKLSGTIDQADALVGVGGPGPDLNFYEGKLRLFANGDVLISSFTTPPDVWRHFALVRGGGVLTLYVDGIEDVQGTWTGAFTPNVLGWGNAGKLGGTMDDTRIYGRALKPEEVKLLADNEPYGLVVHYPMDDGYGTSVDDAVPFDASAPALGGVLWENGVRDGAAQLDGVNDAIDMPDLSFSGDFTVAAWVRPTRDITNLDGLVGVNGAGQDINFYAGKLRLYAPTDVIVAATPIESNVWTHCAITRQGNALKLYLNGILDATGTWSGAFTPKVIGRGNAGYFRGALDDVRFYDEALSAGQVQTLARFSPNAPLAHWTLDDGAGTVAVDAVSTADAACSDATPSWTSAGQSRGAISLDGVSDWLDPDGISLGGDFTLAAWVNIPSPINNADAILGQEGAGPDLNFFGQKLRLYSAAAAGDVVIASNALTASTFTHYAVTRKDGRVNMYVNGVKDTGATATGCWFGTMPVEALGRGSAGYLNGTLDDVIVYERALRPTEIERLADDTPSRLTAHWMFNEAPNSSMTPDGSGNGFNGYPQSGATFATGRVSNALWLDGTNDWVSIPDITASGDFTVVFWVNLASGIGNQDAVLGKSSGGMDMNFYAGKLRLYTGSSDAIVAATSATAGVWTEYAIVRSGSSLKLYVNGTLDATGSWSGTFAPNAIGRGNAGFFGGMIDDLRVYYRALSASEL
ncbi:MAG: LamG-like jellyroll fold domain-containing protein [Polyangiaceae bacterium]